MLHFVKYQGLGNDFVLLDALKTGELIRPSEAVWLCDRRRGVGGDGVLTVLPSRNPDFAARMHLFNADGSVAEMCGNGLRCVVRWLVGRGVASPMVIDTDAGPRRGELLPDGRVRVGLGSPVIFGARTLTVGDRTLVGLEVSMGNPHFVLQPYGEAADLVALALELGPLLERHPAFPNRTNVELIGRRGDSLEVVVFERGAGLTLACGTGAGAAATAAWHWAMFPRAEGLRIQLPGGPLTVESHGGELSLIGDAVKVFEGHVEVPGRGA